MFVAKSVYFAVFLIRKDSNCFLIWQKLFFSKGAVAFVCYPFDVMVWLHNVIYGYNDITSANFNNGFVLFDRSVVCVFDLFCHWLTATSRLYPTVMALARLECLSHCATFCTSVKFHKNLLLFTIVTTRVYNKIQKNKNILSRFCPQMPYKDTMKLSVCLIVKNEEKVIERCLDCVKKFADEIVVVDTGSTDKTKTLAQKYTDKVFDFVWCNDFSKARNFAFEKATCDYVMWVDADDVISDANAKKITSLKPRLCGVDVVMAKYVIGFDENDKPNYSYFRERILKRGKFFWQGFVHEVIVPSGKIIFEDFEVWHKKLSSSDPKRNLKIYLTHKRAGEIFDTRSQYYFAKEYFYLGKYKSAIKNLKKYLKMPNKFLPNQIDAMYTIARCFYFLQQDQKALDMLFEIIKNFQPSSETLCLVGQIYFDQQKYTQAINFYKFATTIDADFECGNFVDMEYYYFVPYLQLVCLYYHVGDLQSAYVYHQKLKKFYPDRKQVLYNQKFFD